MEKDYCVYCHINNINGKRYIGITCQKPERRWKNGKGYINNNYFYRAIQKYGWHNFSHNVLYTDLNKEDAERIEIELIAKYGTINPNRGYNIEKGGNGTEKFTPEIKKKISDALTGHSCSEETKRKIRNSKIGEPTGRRGVKMTPEQVEKNRLSHIGQPAWNRGRAWTREERAKCNGKAVICIETGVEYLTAHEAAIDTKTDFSSICKCCRGMAKTVGGYHWRYKEEWEIPADE